MRPFRLPQVDDFTRKKKDIVNHMYIAAMKTRFSKLDQKNLAMKIQVWEKQHPSDKIFFRGYGNVIEENNQEYGEADMENQRDFSDDIKVRSNFKVNHSNFFCEEA